MHNGVIAILEVGASHKIKWLCKNKVLSPILETRDNELKRIPFLLIVGEKEQDSGTVAVRKQGEGDQGVLSVEAFAEMVKEML